MSDSPYAPPSASANAPSGATTGTLTNSRDGFASALWREMGEVSGRSFWGMIVVLLAIVAVAVVAGMILRQVIPSLGTPNVAIGVMLLVGTLLYAFAGAMMSAYFMHRQQDAEGAIGKAFATTGSRFLSAWGVTLILMVFFALLGTIVYQIQKLNLPMSFMWAGMAIFPFVALLAIYIGMRLSFTMFEAVTGAGPIAAYRNSWAQTNKRLMWLMAGFVPYIITTVIIGVVIFSVSVLVQLLAIYGNYEVAQIVQYGSMIIAYLILICRMMSAIAVLHASRAAEVERDGYN